MLRWLLNELDGRGWFVRMCFLDDPTHIRSTREEWRSEFHAADELLGIDRPVPNYGHVFLGRPAAVIFPGLGVACPK